MNWNKLENLTQLDEIIKESQDRPVMIFKHSTSCSISSMALNRLSRNWKTEDSEKVTPYYLDLISFREISNKIADQFGVYHQSPQVILIKEGKATYENSHMGINYQEIMDQAT